MTVPQVRAGLAAILHRASGCDEASRVTQERTLWLERTELARFYHYKALKQMAPLKIHLEDRPRQ